MRIKMLLSSEAEYILQTEKENIKAKEDISVTLGWLVNKATKNIYKYKEDGKKIDWKKVKVFPLKLSVPKDTDDYECNTTLNLEKTVVEIIEKLQIEFKEIFEAKRIHKAFVVRMILKANYILNNNIVNIVK